jgi:CHU_C Type IX secretion signal domain
MRDELHLMELVDRYLDGSMNAKERTTFEARAKANVELRELVDDQRALREGVARMNVRISAAKAYRSYRSSKPGPWIGGAVLVAVLLTAALYIVNRPESTTAQNELSQTPTTFTETALSTTDSLSVDSISRTLLNGTIGARIAPLVMTIDPNRDTTMLTPHGVLLDVPRRSFVDASGAVIIKPVRIMLLEAFDAATIMKAGLSTMSRDTLLETGGMFHIAAQSEGREVMIAPDRALNMLIPADGADSGMMLYEGLMGADSIVDWRNPKPLPRTLVPVDITTLDFYPPNYLTKLAELGQDAGSKRFTDSLYFAFDCNGGSQNEAPVVEEALMPTLDDMSDDPINAGAWARADSFTAYSATADRSDAPSTFSCGIDPSKVKAIWNPRFNATRLATREFEERMRAIHRTCDNEVLDLYANALNADMSATDRLVWKRGHSEFKTFAERNDGTVSLPAESAERLKRIYAEWSRAYAEAERAAQESYWSKQRELDRAANGRAQLDAQAEQAARQQLIEAETEANLRSVYQQLGYGAVPAWARGGSAEVTASRISLPRVPRSAFNARVSRSGWHNCDVAFDLANTRRTTRMGTAGRRAVITYEPCVVVVPDANTYDLVRCYLLPREGAGYQRMDPVATGRYQENLNSLYTYDVAVLAQKDGRSWFYEYDKVSGLSAITASLAPVTEQQLTTRLMRYEKARSTGLLNASSYMATAAVDAKRQRANMDRVRLREAMRPVVFPCEGSGQRGEASMAPELEAPRNIAISAGGLPAQRVVPVTLQNILTPDGDGVNDRLTIPGGPFVNATMTVLNARGERIFSETAQNPGWNGRLSNFRKAPNGMYKVMVEALSAGGLTYRGQENVKLMWPEVDR